MSKKHLNVHENCYDRHREAATKRNECQLGCKERTFGGARSANGQTARGARVSRPSSTRGKKIAAAHHLPLATSRRRTWPELGAPKE
jgi:hypothetical protein